MGSLHTGVIWSNYHSYGPVIGTLKWRWRGTASSWSFDEINVHVPNQIWMSPSFEQGQRSALTDGDLFLNEIDIPNLSKEIEEALREAVKCFRHELFTACLAMLGKASEGAWIETGVAISELLTPSKKISPEKIKDEFVSPNVGIAKKIQNTLKLFELPEIQAKIGNECGLRPQDLRNSVISAWPNGCCSQPL